MEALGFEDTIHIINGNPYVTPPKRVLENIYKQAGKNKSPIPVQGKINGKPYTQTLVKYMGEWRLYINGMMLKAAGIKFREGEISQVVGKKVKIEITYDGKSREIPMQVKLLKALGVDKKAKTAFGSLVPSRKQEILRYLGSLKTEISINRNVKRIIKHLKGEETDGLYALMHRRKA